MDPTKYKDVKVQRGYNYHYYYSPASEGKPTLLFIHGFPSTSYDWTRQVTYFQPKGYGILVPDCLGYGGTSNPLDKEAYRMKLQVQDLVDILDTEHLGAVIGIAHDWGSALLSRLANYHSDRFLAFAWVALAYSAPMTQPFDYKAMIEMMQKLVGSDVFGYWEFLCEPDAHLLIEENIGSFIRLGLMEDQPATWQKHICPIGGMKKWVKENRQPDYAPYMTEEEFTNICNNMLKGGLEAPLNFYKAAVGNVDLEDNQAIPKEAYHIKKPAFFAAALRDAVCLAQFGKADMQKYAPDAEIVDFDAGHWLQMEATEKFNDVLCKWLEKVPVTNSVL